MCRDFWSLTDYDDAFDPEHVLAMVREAHAHQLLVVLSIDDNLCGFVAGIAMPLLGNGSVTQVTELAYWINPKQQKRGLGIELLGGLETAARAIDAKYLNMISLEAVYPEVANRIYQRQGFTRIETVWRKEL